MSFRILTALVSAIALMFVSLPVEAAKKQIKRDLSKEYDDLTPGQRIAIRAAAKAAYKAKKLETQRRATRSLSQPIRTRSASGGTIRRPLATRSS